MARLDWIDRVYDSRKFVSRSYHPLKLVFTSNAYPVILQMRLYALYHLDKKILVLMISTFLIASAAAAGIIGHVLSTIIGQFQSHSIRLQSAMPIPLCSSDPSPHPWRGFLLCYQYPRLLFHVLGPNNPIRDSPLQLGAIPRVPDIPRRRLPLPISVRAAPRQNPDPGFRAVFPRVSLDTKT